MRVNGCATLLGDDVDTDTIFPGRYLAVLRPEDQARHLFEPLDADLRARIVSGGVVVAGWNFGCGSSREHAVTAMLGAGIRLVVAKSFSRIFFRNAVNNGLAVVISPELVDAVQDGAEIEVDLKLGQARLAQTEVAFTSLPSEVLSILVAGGLWAAKSNNAESKVLQ